MLAQHLYFQLHRLIGSRVGEYYQEFFQLERASRDDLQALQAERLESLLQRAVSSVPYYRERVSQKKDLTLSDFPILTKSQIRENYDDLMADKLRSEYHAGTKTNKIYSWVEVKTGGSTGVPTSVIHDKELRDRGRASRLYAQHLCGFPLGVPYFRLWGNMRDINNNKASRYHRVASYLAKESILNAFQMIAADIERHIDTINTSSPRNMMAYADAAYEVAKYSLRMGKPIKPLNSIMSCASTLSPHMRETMQQAFHARVHNKYGSRDCTDTACECEEGNLHIFSNHVILEVVDENGAPLPRGETGRILLTPLFNSSFPLIRYEIGDMGALSDGQCPCGRPFPLLDRLDGRTIEFLLNNAGEYVSPSIVTGLIGIAHNPGFIKRFQLVQSSLVDYEIAFEMEPGIPEMTRAEALFKIERDLKVVLGKDSNIVMRDVDEIPPSSSGKFLYTVNKVKNLRRTDAIPGTSA